MSGLTADFRVRRIDFALDLTLDVDPGRVLALLGPNGAGKSTTLLAIAGAVGIDEGRISSGERVLADPAAGVHEPIERRNVGIVFQEYLLFPHLSIEQNVAFGPRARGVARREATQRASEWLERFGLGALAHRRPSDISGGQAQRVALARALAADPDVLLLDEPLAALDAEIRDDMREDLASHLREFRGVTVVVTHSLADARALADDVVVLERGRVTQRGTVAELVARPATPWVARLAAAG